jgi:hypothetical protein
MRRISISPPAEACEAQRTSLAVTALWMPSSVLRIMAPGSTLEVQHALRLAFADFIKANADEAYTSISEAWNAWIHGREYVELHAVRCGACDGKGFLRVPSARGYETCGACSGSRHVRVRQAVVAVDAMERAS